MHFTKLAKPQKSEWYASYWRFAVERHGIFTKRLTQPRGPWTDDPILGNHRFTNVFRAADRVSQYLIKLQYDGTTDARDIFFKTLLFKFFNRIDTHLFLEKHTDITHFSLFDVAAADTLLTCRMAEKHKIYSAAYIMPSAGRTFGHIRKHSNHLSLLLKMMADGLTDQIAESSSLEAVYNLLLAYPSLGKFLAFQYAIDLNYSPLINFSEMDFVVAGPGALNGIAKCFSSLGGHTPGDIIRLMADEQENECLRLGLEAPSLWGRRLQLIDCQNLFCEVDKYLRGTTPLAAGLNGRKRIKQRFTASAAPLPLYFPPKWEVNHKIPASCRPQATAAIYS